jgi:hypothetical protein
MQSSTHVAPWPCWALFGSGAGSCPDLWHDSEWRLALGSWAGSSGSPKRSEAWRRIVVADVPRSCRLSSVSCCGVGGASRGVERRGAWRADSGSQDPQDAFDSKLGGFLACQRTAHRRARGRRLFLRGTATEQRLCAGVTAQSLASGTAAARTDSRRLPSCAASSQCWAGLGFQEAAHLSRWRRRLQLLWRRDAGEVLGRDEWLRQPEARGRWSPDRPTWLLCSVALLSCLPWPLAARSQLAAAREAQARCQCCLRARSKRATAVSRRGPLAAAPPAPSSKDLPGPSRTNSPLHHPSTLDAKAIGVAPRRCCPFGRAFRTPVRPPTRFQRLPQTCTRSSLPFAPATPPLVSLFAFLHLASSPKPFALPFVSRLFAFSTPLFDFDHTPFRHEKG